MSERTAQIQPSEILQLNLLVADIEQKKDLTEEQKTLLMDFRNVIESGINLSNPNIEMRHKEVEFKIQYIDVFSDMNGILSSKEDIEEKDIEKVLTKLIDLMGNLGGFYEQLEKSNKGQFKKLTHSVQSLWENIQKEDVFGESDSLKKIKENLLKEEKEETLEVLIDNYDFNTIVPSSFWQNKVLNTDFIRKIQKLQKADNLEIMILAEYNKVLNNHQIILQKNLNDSLSKNEYITYASVERKEQKNSSPEFYAKVSYIQIGGQKGEIGVPIIYDYNVDELEKIFEKQVLLEEKLEIAVLMTPADSNEVLNVLKGEVYFDTSELEKTDDFVEQINNLEEERKNLFNEYTELLKERKNFEKLDVIEKLDDLYGKYGEWNDSIKKAKGYEEKAKKWKKTKDELEDIIKGAVQTAKDKELEKQEKLKNLEPKQIEKTEKVKMTSSIETWIKENIFTRAGEEEKSLNSTINLLDSEKEKNDEYYKKVNDRIWKLIKENENELGFLKSAIIDKQKEEGFLYNENDEFKFVTGKIIDELFNDKKVEPFSEFIKNKNTKFEDGKFKTKDDFIKYLKEKFLSENVKIVTKELLENILEDFYYKIERDTAKDHFAKIFEGKSKEDVKNEVHKHMILDEDIKKLFGEDYLKSLEKTLDLTDNESQIEKNLHTANIFKIKKVYGDGFEIRPNAKDYSYKIFKKGKPNKFECDIFEADGEDDLVVVKDGKNEWLNKKDERTGDGSKKEEKEEKKGNELVSEIILSVKDNKWHVENIKNIQKYFSKDVFVKTEDEQFAKYKVTIQKDGKSHNYIVFKPYLKGGSKEFKDHKNDFKIILIDEKYNETKEWLTKEVVERIGGERKKVEVKKENEIILNSNNKNAVKKLLEYNGVEGAIKILIEDNKDLVDYEKYKDILDQEYTFNKKEKIFTKEKIVEAITWLYFGQNDMLDLDLFDFNQADKKQIKNVVKNLTKEGEDLSFIGRSVPEALLMMHQLIKGKI